MLLESLFDPLWLAYVLSVEPKQRLVTWHMTSLRRSSDLELLLNPKVILRQEAARQVLRLQGLLLIERLDDVGVFDEFTHALALALVVLQALAKEEDGLQS